MSILQNMEIRLTSFHLRRGGAIKISDIKRKYEMKSIILTVLLLANHLQADYFSDANEAYKNGDFKKTCGLMKKSCDDGYMRACWDLGLLYSNGRCAEGNRQKALGLYKKACDGGYEKGCDSYEIFKDIK